MTLTPLMIVLIGLAGGGVGIVAGVFGVGGGFLLVPVLTGLVGVPVELAVGAAACQALGPATTSLLYRQVERSDLRLPLVMVGGLLVGVVAGASTLEWATGFVGAEGSERFAERVVLGPYLVLLTGLGSFAVWESRRTANGNPINRGVMKSLPLPPFGHFKDELKLGRTSIPVLSWFGLAIGYLSGLLGMSGGLVLLPGIVYLFGVPSQQAVRCSLVVVWIVSAQSTIVHSLNDNVDLRLVAGLLLGGAFGARLGSEVGSRLGGERLRRHFGWLLLAAAAMIVAFEVRAMLKQDSRAPTTATPVQLPAPRTDPNGGNE